MRKRWRLINTGALDIFSNMAFDEAILRGCQDLSSPPTFRIYGWKKPSLSIGYSQDPRIELDLQYCRDNSVPFVRRITGGGIILHGNEITYSLACRKKDLGLPVCVGPSYKTISSFLIGFYKALGIEAAFACEAVRDEILGRRSSLCFDSKEKYDMVANGRKMGGSAQKRSRDLIFQHGSIPIDFGRKDVSYFLRSKDRRVDGGGAACLEEMLGKDVDGFVLSRALIDAFARSFNADFEVGGLTGDEEELFSGLKRYKYETDEWNIYRVDKFSGKTFAAAGMDQ